MVWTESSILLDRLPASTRRSHRKIAKANIHLKIARANIVMITSISERAPLAPALRKSPTVCSKHEPRRWAGADQPLRRSRYQRVGGRTSSGALIGKLGMTDF